MNLIIFLSSYFIITTSLIGYGSVLQKILNKKLELEFEFNLLGSILFLIVLSFSTHFFFSHNYLHNGIVIILGFIFFLITIIKNKRLLNKYSKYFILIFSVLIF